MHLLMTTCRQDIMTNFGCMHDLFNVSNFQGSFSKHTQTFLSTEVCMLKNNFTSVLFKSNTKFSMSFKF